MRTRTAIQGVVFITTVFILLPEVFISLGESFGWPSWRSEPTGVLGGVTSVLGGAMILAAIAVAIHCSDLFRRIGRGTPVPTEPPERLVVAGLYRYSRNPIYVADVVIILGMFLLRGDPGLLLYAVVMAGFIELFIVAYEEPGLRRRFGGEYDRYLASVPRWVGTPARA